MAVDRTAEPVPTADGSRADDPLDPAAARDLHRQASGLPGGTTQPDAVGADTVGGRTRPPTRRRLLRSLLAVALLLALGGTGVVVLVDRSPGIVGETGAATSSDADPDVDAVEGGADLDIEVETPPPGFALGEEAADDVLAAIEIDGPWARGRGATDPVPPLPPRPDPQPDPDPGSDPDDGGRTRRRSAPRTRTDR